MGDARSHHEKCRLRNPGARRLHVVDRIKEFGQTCSVLLNDEHFAKSRLLCARTLEPISG